ncbi:hypothetical protein KUV89_02435 [Marinobacter hydrocarbonoclasticus]|nr:hypothetical protein [Marinobacter nauticus]
MMKVMLALSKQMALMTLSLYVAVAVIWPHAQYFEGLFALGLVMLLLNSLVSLYGVVKSDCAHSLNLPWCCRSANCGH